MRLILPQRLAQWSSEVAIAAERYQVPADLIFAVMDRESRGGDALTPRGPGGTGDHGHGRGLMQIDDRWHKSWLALDVWRDPLSNILYGTGILATGIERFARRHDPDPIFAATAAYNCGPGNVIRALEHLPAGATPEERRKAIDSRTTGANYAADVFARRALFLPPVPAAIPPKCTLT